MYTRGHPLSKRLVGTASLVHQQPIAVELNRRAPLGSLSTATAPPALGTIQRIEYEINQIVNSNTERQRWGVNGNLQNRLEIRRFMSSSAWAPNIPFRSANYQGSNKCNVFALDLGWRCGFNVPVLIYNYPPQRHTFPLANQLTTYAQRAFTQGNTELIGQDGRTRWGWVDTGIPRTDINAFINDGWFYIIVGWRRRRGTGHVGIIRRIEALTTNSSGRIQSITYEGWEARQARAERVTGHEWRTTQCGVTTPPCPETPANTLKNFCAIHILCLDWETNEAQRAVRVSHVNKCRLN